MNGENKGKMATVKKIGNSKVISLKYGEMYGSGRGECEQAFVSSGTVGFLEMKLRNLTSDNVRSQGSIHWQKKKNKKQITIAPCSCTKNVILAIFKILQKSGTLGKQNE